MSYEVTLTEVPARHLVVVPARVASGALRDSIPGLLDEAFTAAAASGVQQVGPVVVVYREVERLNPRKRESAARNELGIRAAKAFELEAGFEVAGPTEAPGLVATTTPAGRVATTVHPGPYAELELAHWAILDRCRADGLTWGINWEVYGDWSDDSAQLRTEVFYQLG